MWWMSVYRNNSFLIWQLLSRLQNGNSHLQYSTAHKLCNWNILRVGISVGGCVVKMFKTSFDWNVNGLNKIRHKSQAKSHAFSLSKLALSTPCRVYNKAMHFSSVNPLMDQTVNRLLEPTIKTLPHTRTRNIRFL